MLGAAPFPKLRKNRWKRVVDEFRDIDDDTQFGVALAWFAMGVRALKHEKLPKKLPPRPWAAAFDRAEQRSPEAARGADVIAEWLCDELWSLRWTEELTFDVARAELATRAAVTTFVAGRLEAEGLRADRAAAEAVMIGELLGGSDYWNDIVTVMRP